MYISTFSSNTIWCNVYELLPCWQPCDCKIRCKMVINRLKWAKIPQWYRFSMNSETMAGSKANFFHINETTSSWQSWGGPLVRPQAVKKTKNNRFYASHLEHLFFFHWSRAELRRSRFGPLKFLKVWPGHVVAILSPTTKLCRTAISDLLTS